MSEPTVPAQSGQDAAADSDCGCLPEHSNGLARNESVPDVAATDPRCGKRLHKGCSCIRPAAHEGACNCVYSDGGPLQHLVPMIPYDSEGQVVDLEEAYPPAVPARGGQDAEIEPLSVVPMRPVDESADNALRDRGGDPETHPATWRRTIDRAVRILTADLSGRSGDDREDR